MSEPASLMRDIVLGVLRTYLELTYDQLVEYVWYNADIGENFDSPEKEIKHTLQFLEKEGKVTWNHEKGIIVLTEKEVYDYFEDIPRVDELTKWEISLVGSYKLSSGEEADINLIWESLGSHPIMVGDTIDDPAPSYSEQRGEITIIWAFEAVRCSCIWSSDRFRISAFMFKEPSREMVEYALGQLDPIPDFVMKAIPFTGAYILYSHLKRLVQSIYPDAIFRLTRIGESWVKRG